jgi:hypothetical protein
MKILERHRDRRRVLRRVADRCDDDDAEKHLVEAERASGMVDGGDQLFAAHGDCRAGAQQHHQRGGAAPARPARVSGGDDLTAVELPIGAQGEDEVERVDGDQHQRDLLAERLDARRLLAGTGAGAKEEVIRRRHRQTDRGQRQQRRTHPGRGAVELLAAMPDAAEQRPCLAFAAGVPPGGTCGSRPCWKQTGKRLVYTNNAATPDGIRQLRLSAGGRRKAPSRHRQWTRIQSAPADSDRRYRTAQRVTAGRRAAATQRRRRLLGDRLQQPGRLELRPHVHRSDPLNVADCTPFQIGCPVVGQNRSLASSHQRRTTDNPSVKQTQRLTTIARDSLG